MGQYLCCLWCWFTFFFPKSGFSFNFGGRSEDDSHLKSFKYTTFAILKYQSVWHHLCPASTPRASPCLPSEGFSHTRTPTWQQPRRRRQRRLSRPPAPPARCPGTPSWARHGPGSASTPTSSRCRCLRAPACSPQACRAASTPALNPLNQAAGRPARLWSTTAITRQEVLLGGPRLPKPPWRTQWTSCRAFRDWWVAWRARGRPPRLQNLQIDEDWLFGHEDFPEDNKGKCPVQHIRHWDEGLTDMDVSRPISVFLFPFSFQLR